MDQWLAGKWVRLVFFGFGSGGLVVFLEAMPLFRRQRLFLAALPPLNNGSFRSAVSLCAMDAVDCLSGDLVGVELFFADGHDGFVLCDNRR